MKCYCPKCGHGSEVSAADIRRQKGMVVCPKCLTTFKMPVTDSSALDDDDDDETPPPIPRRRTAQAAPPKPPVRRNSGAGTRRTAPKGGSGNAPASRPRRSGTAPRTTEAKRKPSTTGKGQSRITRSGCVVISIGVTVGFFLIYMLIGLIFDKI